MVGISVLGEPNAAIRTVVRLQRQGFSCILFIDRKLDLFLGRSAVDGMAYIVFRIGIIRL